MRTAVSSVVRGLLHLLIKLFVLTLWVGVKLIHEVSGLIEALLKKKLESR